MFLVGGWCDGTARANECLVSHLAAISSLGVCVQKGETWGFFAAVGLFARIWGLCEWGRITIASAKDGNRSVPSPLIVVQADNGAGPN